MLLYKPAKLIKTLTDRSHQDAFPFEREILLFQFQTWIYSPDSSRVAENSAVLAGAGFLRFLEGRLGGPSRNSAASLSRYLANEEYRALYDAVLKPYGGWSRLWKIPSPSEFDKQLQNRREDVETV